MWPYVNTFIVILALCWYIHGIMRNTRRQWPRLETREDARKWARAISGDYGPEFDYGLESALRSVPFWALSQAVCQHGSTKEKSAQLFAELIRDEEGAKVKTGAVTLLAACWPAQSCKKALMETAGNPHDIAFDTCIRIIFFNLDKALARNLVLEHKRNKRLENEYDFMFKWGA